MTQTHERGRLCWQPEWDGPVKGWTVNFLKRNRWRCDSIEGFDDLLQDAYLVFHKIEQTYPRVVKPEHFMALYQKALANSIHDKARYINRRREAAPEVPPTVTDSNYGYLNRLLGGLPEEVRDLLTMPNDRKRKDLNAILSRAIGYRKVRFDFLATLLTLVLN